MPDETLRILIEQQLAAKHKAQRDAHELEKLLNKSLGEFHRRVHSGGLKSRGLKHA